MESTLLAKRQPGDVWGLVEIDPESGQERRVHFLNWEHTTFPYRKQAEKEASRMNLRKMDGSGKYEARYLGNLKRTKFII